MNNNKNRFRQKSGGKFGANKSSRSKSYNKKSFRCDFSSGRKRNYNKKKSASNSGIDISKFIKKASFSKRKEIKINNLFTDFNLSEKLRKNIKKRNFSKPTPIQDQTISHILEGKDVIGLANTGTGKTGAFLLPLINKVINDRLQKVLIIAPTRELCVQIENEFKMFALYTNIYAEVCIGGLPIFKQIRNLKRNPNFIIGTPGRLDDLEKRGVLNLKSFNNIVVDEVDRMLDMGFIDIIKGIINKTNKEKQVLFFSATMPDSIKKITSKFLHNPITVSVQVNETTDNVDQDIVKSKEMSKIDTLKNLLSDPNFKKVLIFSETKRGVENLTFDLRKYGFRADSIHGDKRQNQRLKSLDKFKNGKVNILVATDVAARGLDIDGITHVINYTIPQTYDDYVHRIGRTGRGGKEGKALTFI